MDSTPKLHRNTSIKSRNFRKKSVIISSKFSKQKFVLRTKKLFCRKLESEGMKLPNQTVMDAMVNRINGFLMDRKTNVNTAETYNQTNAAFDWADSVAVCLIQMFGVGFGILICCNL